MNRIYGLAGAGWVAGAAGGLKFTTGALCARFPKLARVTVIKHLGILEEADLITVEPRGRERWNHLNAVPIQQIYERWITPFEGHWASALLGLKGYLEGK